MQANSIISLSINTDGGARGNPGPAASSYVVKNGNEIIAKGSEYIGITTNNIAEYKALIMALNWLSKNLKNLNINEVIVYMDSELIVNQLKGVYKIKSENLVVLNNDVKKILKHLDIQVKFVHIKRNLNKDADYLVNEVLDNMKTLNGTS